jgi:DNA polymerase III epsilon subunit-like protein
MWIWWPLGPPKKVSKKESVFFVSSCHYKHCSYRAFHLQVNEDGNVLLEEFVAPKEKVTDFRTKVSGVRAADLKRAIPFKEAMRRTHDILAGRIVVGHALHNDFKVSCRRHTYGDAG